MATPQESEPTKGLVVGVPAPPAPVQRPDPHTSSEYRALKQSVEAGRVTFHQVATAWFNSHFGGVRCDRCLGVGTTTVPGGAQDCAVCTRPCQACAGTGTVPDRASAAAYADIFPDLLRVFGDQRGGLITAYFCENIRVGAALTDIWSAADRPDGPIMSVAERERWRGELTQRSEWERLKDWAKGHFRETAGSTAIHLEPTFGDPDSPRAKQILFRCLKVHYQALEFLKPKPRKICMRMTFNVITMLLGTLDNRIGRGEPASAFDKSHDDQRALEAELASTEEYYQRSALRTARLEYLAGMGPGLLLAAVASVALYRLELPSELAISFIAGALGALVSVMERLTSGKLVLNHEAGKATTRLLGAIRPFIGALFGLALYVFISGDVLLSISPPRDPEQGRYFFAAIGFLAGFSERWAQDMLDPSKLPKPGAVPASGRGAPAAR